jgi:hypothetical protein
MMKSLSLCGLKVPIGPAQFTAICQLTNLAELYISGSGYPDEVSYLILFFSSSPRDGLTLCSAGG